MSDRSVSHFRSRSTCCGDVESITCRVFRQNSNKQAAIEDLDRAAKLFQTQGKTKESQEVLTSIEKSGAF